MRNPMMILLMFMSALVAGFKETLLLVFRQTVVATLANLVEYLVNLFLTSLLAGIVLHIVFYWVGTSGGRIPSVLTSITAMAIPAAIS